MNNEQVRAAALEEAATLCETEELMFDLSVWQKTKQGVSGETALALAAAIRAIASSAAPASLPNDEEVSYIATRLRAVARLAGIEDGAIPKDDAAADGARFSILGMIAIALRERAAAPERSGESAHKIISWGGGEVSLDSLLGSLQDYSKIMPIQGRAQWAMREAYRYITATRPATTERSSAPSEAVDVLRKAFYTYMACPTVRNYDALLEKIPAVCDRASLAAPSPTGESLSAAPAQGGLSDAEIHAIISTIFADGMYSQEDIEIARAIELRIQSGQVSDAADAWQPIETAPKDTALLLYCQGCYELGHFNTALERWVDCDRHRPMKPTHWQPLPALPAIQAQAGDAAKGDVA